MPSKKNRLKIELIKTYYQTSRANLANRLRLRDMAIMTFLLVIGILFGISFSRDAGYYQKPLLIIPFLSFAVMILVNYYNEYIARIVHYLGYDIYKEINDLGVSITEWSYAHGHLDLDKNKWLGANRGAAERMIVCLPALFALILTLRSFLEQLNVLFKRHLTMSIDLLIICGWLLGVLLLFLAYSTNRKASRFKANIYEPARTQPEIINILSRISLLMISKLNTRIGVIK